VQADNISTLVKAAGLTVEPYWPSLFAKLFAKKSVEDLITNIGSGVWRAAAAWDASSSSRSSSHAQASSSRNSTPATGVVYAWSAQLMGLQMGQATCWCTWPLCGRQPCLGQHRS
jgi:hypothetical protein